MKLPLLLSLAALASSTQGALIISQYVDTESGTTPKGIELWNSGASAIDFSAQELDVSKGTNGGIPVSDVTVSSGILGAGEVMVIGTTDMGTYLDDTFGVAAPLYVEEPFTFNGDDSLEVTLGVNLQDTFGIPEDDPGASWSGSGVSTEDQNIALNSGITEGASGGFSDPSTRFSTVSESPSDIENGGLEGFGVAPVPEPTIALLGGLGVFGLLRRRR